jgi:hypothetical protein
MERLRGAGRNDLSSLIPLSAGREGKTGKGKIPFLSPPYQVRGRLFYKGERLERENHPTLRFFASLQNDK